MGITTEQVWEAFHTPLYQFIRRRVADEATAEDLLDDASQTANREVRPFSPNSVSTSKGKREGRSALLVVLNGKEQTDENRSPER